MLGRKPPSLASPRSHSTIRHLTSPSTTSPGHPLGESTPKNSEGADPTQAGQVRLKLAAAYARVSTDRQEQQESIGS